MSVEKIKDKSKRVHDQLANTYDSSYAGKHSRALYNSVLQKLDSSSYLSVLDVGCGTGNLLSLISRRKEVALSGIDISPQMIRIAKERLDEKADLRVGDSEHLPWEEKTFDVVTCTDSFHHYPRPINVLAEIRRVMKPQGRLIIADPWWRTPIREVINLFLPLSKYGDVRVYSKPEISSLLEESGFRSVEWERVGNSGYIVTAVAESRCAMP